MRQTRLPMPWPRLPAAAALLLAAALLAGCQVNPATGREQFVMGSVQQDAAIGRQQHAQVLAEFGGVYDDPALTAYVDQIGQRLATQTEFKGLPYTFTVLDDDLVNAFALPGGYVYVTRGLVAWANDEAELASVIAHEIGHVTARHGAERIGRTTIAGIGLAVLGIATDSPDLQQAAGVGAQLVLSAYSRDQELEADDLGIRYLGRAGYDPMASPDFLTQLERSDRYEALVDGRSGNSGGLGGYFSTHPPTGQRIRIARAAVTPGARGVRGEETHMARVAGLLWGESPDRGFVRGGTFLLPDPGIRWEATAPFTLDQAPGGVVGREPGGGQLLFDHGTLTRPMSPDAYLTQVWARDLRLDRVERISVNGFPAATGTARVNTRSGPADLRLIAIAGGERLYRFQFLTPVARTRALSEPLRRITYSFRPTGPGDRALMRPRRLAVETVRPGQTAQEFARRMAVEQRPLELFLALNGLDSPTQLRAGDRVKLVVPG